MFRALWQRSATTVGSSLALISPISSSLVPSNTLLAVQNVRFVQTAAERFGMFGQPQEEGLMKRFAKRLGWTETSRSTLNATGYLLYIKVADSVDYTNFFKYCSMEDTFVSWFTCMELHIWMLSVRLMELGDEGKIIRNALIKAMWEDCDTKSKKLEGALGSARKKQIQVLSEEFQASLLSYDEGLLGNDRVLAGALWRRFLRNQTEQASIATQEDLHNQLVALEMLVIYVRSQYFSLNQLSKEKVMKRRFSWSPFDKKLFDLADRLSQRQAAVN